MKQVVTRALLAICLMLVFLFFDPEDGGYTFL
jgi:hypothetical protein